MRKKEIKKERGRESTLEGECLPLCDGEMQMLLLLATWKSFAMAFLLT